MTLTLQTAPTPSNVWKVETGRAQPPILQTTFQCASTAAIVPPTAWKAATQVWRLHRAL